MKKLGINTISNISTKLWSLISIYIFIPAYIQILGETSYGLVSFFATLQTTLNLLGLGLSNTLRREFAAGEDTYINAVRKYKLLRSIELIYFALSLIIIAICFGGATFISVNWLHIEELNPIIVEKVISLMGISIALQLIANLYSGCLFGLDYQVLSNNLCIAWSVAKSIGALMIISIIESNLVYFYSWHIAVDFLYLVLLRYFSIKRLNCSGKAKWSFENITNLKSIWRYSCGILFISCIAMINKELDKVIISKFLTLTELGAYNVAITLGNLTTIIPAAVYTTVFPHFTYYATTNNTSLLSREFVNINKLVNIVLSAMGAFIAVYSLPLIKIWTGSDEYIDILGAVGGLVVVAVTIAEYQEIPYALALANGNTKYNIIVGSIFIPVIGIATFLGIKNFGLLGAGIVYIAMMLGQTLVYEYLVFKKYIDKNPILMIVKSLISPLFISLSIALLSKIVINQFYPNVWIQFIYAVICGTITLLMLVFFMAHDELNIIYKKVKGEKI